MPIPPAEKAAQLAPADRAGSADDVVVAPAALARRRAAGDAAAVLALVADAGLAKKIAAPHSPDLPHTRGIALNGPMEGAAGFCRHHKVEPQHGFQDQVVDGGAVGGGARWDRQPLRLLARASIRGMMLLGGSTAHIRRGPAFLGNSLRLIARARPLWRAMRGTQCSPQLCEDG